jgi:hypothetical protein
VLAFAPMGHSWHFFRAGGVDQVSLRNGADLLALPDLDQKLWMALAIPSTGIDVDPRTLELLDHDKDGRVRVPDIIDAVQWIAKTWKSADDVLKGGDSLALASIKDAAVLGAAKRILADLGKKEAMSISLAEVLGVVEAFTSTKLNGDGVIIPDTADDADVKQAIEEIIAGAGAVTDRSGKPGIDQVRTDAFFADIDKLAGWIGEGAAHMALGDGTAAAADALVAVKAKIDDYFARSALAAFDPRAAAALNGQDADLVALGGKLLSAASEEVARLPLARIEAGKSLPLDGSVNPAWADKIEAFREHTVKAVLGKKSTTLSADDFAKITTKLAGYLTWHAARPHTAADKLDEARIKALATGTQRAEIAKLIAADKALEGEYGAIASVEKLLRIQRDFGRVVRNFVNFSDFYSRRDAAFQAGTLYLDGRAFKLSVPVADAAKHGALAAMSSSYLAYCDIARGAAKKAIVVAVTNGDADNIFVGRNGIFYDREGNDWDATVTKIVSNPISIREAFWAPYKKLVRLVEEQVNKRAAEADAKSHGKIEGAATKVATIDLKPAAAGAPAPAPAPAAAPATAAAAAAPAPKKGLDIGIIAVISLAIGAVVGAIGGLIAVLIGMGVWMPVGVLAVVLAISGPSMILAWMKLRQRNLGPILDANGWAVNTRARVNVSFGAALTDLAVLPKGHSRSFDDPFADKGRPWKFYTFVVVLLVTAASWYAGKLDKYLPKVVKSGEVLGENAPINQNKPPAPKPDVP